MRHVGSEGDLSDRHGLVGASHGEAAVGKFDIPFRGFQRMGCDLFALGNEFVAGP